MLTKNIPTQNQLMPFANNIPEGAKYFNKSTRTIRRWLKERGIYKPQIKYRPGKVDKKKACEIRRLYKEGLTQAEIGKFLKLSQTTIGKVVNNEANLTLSGEVIVKLSITHNAINATEQGEST